MRGGFKTCPQILRYSSLQELRLIPLPGVKPGFSELLLMNRILQKWWCVRKGLCSFLLGSLRSLSLGKAYLQVLKTPKQTYKEVSWKRPEACQQPCEWAILEMDPAAPVKPRWCRSGWQTDCSLGRGRPWSRAIQLSHSWVPDSQKLGNDKCLCFNLLTCQRVIRYKIIDNKYTYKNEISCVCGRGAGCI